MLKINLIWGQQTDILIFILHFSEGFGLYCIVLDSELFERETDFFTSLHFTFYLPSPKASLPRQGNEKGPCRRGHTNLIM